VSSPFLRGDRWWARIPRIGRPLGRQRALGVEGKENRALAEDVCLFLRTLKRQQKAYLLEQLEEGKVPVYRAYGAFTAANLDQFIRDLKSGTEDPDIEPHVVRWQKELERRGKPNAESRRKYLRQVRTLIPEGEPFRRSSFTKQRIRTFLSELEVGQPNRYRAALSSFAEYLLFEDAIASNPVRLVPMAKEREPRTLHLSPEDALRLVHALPEPYRELHALMLATGMEISAALRVRRRDIDVGRKTVYARGTKRQSRERMCTVYSRWEPLFRYVQSRSLGLLPDAPLFPHATSEASLDELRAALKALGLPPEYRQHDHRHTWAVQAIRDGLALHTIAHQLGHRDATMVLKVYGRFMPNAGDFATKSATTEADLPTDTRSRGNG
jgi:integrase